MTEINVHWQGGGVIPTWGNYGGKGWTGGDPARNFFDAPALNTPDRFFQEHDLNYFDAEFETDPSIARQAADLKLIDQLNEYSKTSEYQALHPLDKTYLKMAIEYFGIKTVAQNYFSPLGLIKTQLLYGTMILKYLDPQAQGLTSNCFAKGTSIGTSNGKTKLIEDITICDTVECFSESGKLKSDLQHSSVTRLFRNLTTEWLILSCGLTVTPGHHFLNEHGAFERIDALVSRGGMIVREDGSCERVTAERIVYSEATRHLYEEAEEIVYASAGGIRVHNDSLQDYLALSAMMKEQFLPCHGTSRHRALPLGGAHDGSLFPGRPELDQRTQLYIVKEKNSSPGLSSRMSSCAWRSCRVRHARTGKIGIASRNPVATIRCAHA